MHKIVLPIEQVLPDDVYFIYYPGPKETQTRVTEFKKFTNHKSSNSLITLEVPSLKNKLYPTLLKSQVELAEKYIKRLPEYVTLLEEWANIDMLTSMIFCLMQFNLKRLS